VLGRHPGRATGAASSAAGLGASAAAALRAAPAPVHAGPAGPSGGAPGASAAPSASASAMTCGRRSARYAHASGCGRQRLQGWGRVINTHLTLIPARHAHARGARLIGECLPAGHGAHGCAAGVRGPARGVIVSMRLALPRGQACRMRRPWQLGVRLLRTSVTGGDWLWAASAGNARTGLLAAGEMYSDCRPWRLLGRAGRGTSG